MPDATHTTLREAAAAPIEAAWSHEECADCRALADEVVAVVLEHVTTAITAQRAELQRVHALRGLTCVVEQTEALDEALWYVRRLGEAP